MESTGYSLSDIAAATGNGNGYNNGGFGGDWAAWIVLFLIFGMFGWGGFGGFGGFGMGGGSAMQGALTRGDLCMDMNFAELKSTAQNTADAVALGFSELNSTICHQQYDTAQQLNAMNISNMQNANAANVVALQNANAIQAQLAQCCCDQRVGQMQLGNQMESGFCTTNYNAATNTNAIIQNAHNDTDRIIARLDAMEMSRKDETIADLRTRLANCNDQTTAQYIINQLSNVINPPAVPAYPAASPCGLGNWAPQVLANGYGYNGCNCAC